MAEILDGKKVSQKVKDALKEETKAFFEKYGIRPGLAVVIVGDDPASRVYVNSKKKACEEIGYYSEEHALSKDTTESELLSLVEKLNGDGKIHGILVQLPLPAHLDTTQILGAVAPEKDVDGFHPLNAGLVVQKQAGAFLPCTPKGIIRLLRQTGKDLNGLNAVVVGRSQIVGLPAAHLLLNENCTVTVAHSRTRGLASLCRSADILVAAVGKPEFITRDFIKPSAIIIDVGINRTPDGLKGDVCFSEAIETASYITPVPGGVGPMTIAMLLENTCEAFLKQHRP